MKTRIITWIVLFLLIVAAVVLVIEHRKANRAGKTDSQPNVAAAPFDANTNRNDTAAASTLQPTPVETMSNAPEVLQTSQQPSAQNITDAYSKQLHQPIDFYGRIIDDLGAAIEGAKVKFVWTHYVQPEATYETNVTSDENGRFSLTGAVGATLNVEVSKEGYYRMGDASVKSFSYSKAQFNQPFQSDPNNPVVFKLRKKGNGVNLVTSDNEKGPEYSVPLPLDGTPVKIDLLQRLTSDSGQIEISQKKPEFKDWKQANEWSLKMTISGGGFVEENDQFPFEAPETGYQPTVELNFQKGLPDWRTDLSKDYYFEFGNPPKFGHLHISTAILIDDVRLTYQINPDGSRNLEPKE